jgi:hypothetical protein
MLALSSVFSVDYDIMHRCFAHPSKDVLRMHQEIHRISQVICRSPLLILYVRVVLKER